MADDAGAGAEIVKVAPPVTGVTVTAERSTT
jgi:hypothetical protein